MVPCGDQTAAVSLNHAPLKICDQLLLPDLQQAELSIYLHGLSLLLGHNIRFIFKKEFSV